MIILNLEVLISNFAFQSFYLIFHVSEFQLFLFRIFYFVLRVSYFVFPISHFTFHIYRSPLQLKSDTLTNADRDRAAIAYAGAEAPAFNGPHGGSLEYRARLAR
jgi:hypothetical protein